MNRKAFLLERGPRTAMGLAAAWGVAIVIALLAGWAFRFWWLVVLFVLLNIAGSLAVWVRWQREVAIREGVLPQFLKRKLRETHPQLDGRDCDLVERGFRQFFNASLRSKGQLVAMPSQVVDTYWHEFILHTRAYDEWCRRTLGRFLHHTPAEVLGSRAPVNDGLRRAWFWSCREESINPRKPSRLPLLFALDGKLAIAGGFRYVTDCRGLVARAKSEGQQAGNAHCGTDFSDGSFDGDAGSMGGADASGDGGGDGGDGGGGCGGD